MSFVITPNYSDMFDGELPKISDLLQSYNRDILILKLSYLNAEFYNSEDLLQKKQDTVLYKLLDEDLFEMTQISNKISDFKKQKAKDSVSVFNPQAIMSLIHFVILNNDNRSIKVEGHGINLFKAILVYNELIDKSWNDQSFDRNKDDLHNFFVWSTLPNQFSLNKRLNYFTLMIKSKCFFDCLLQNQEFELIVKKYLAERNEPNSLNWLFKYIRLVQGGHVNEGDDAKFTMEYDDEFKHLFLDHSLNIDSYIENSLEDEKMFGGIISNPLYQIRNTFIVLNWNYFVSQIFIGQFFKIQNLVQKELGLKFDQFKQRVGDMYVEKYLFRKIINYIFNYPDSVVYFDETNDSGLFDAYVRVKNKILVFEIKDVMFSSTNLKSNEPSNIYNEVDKKYNSDKKGTGQLIKAIGKLRNQAIYRDDLMQLSDDSLEIYPVLIYTDTYFEMPGIYKYLREEFYSKLSAQDWVKNFKVIHPLKFLSIDYFIDHIDLFKLNEFRLDVALDEMEEEYKLREKLWNEFKNELNNSLLNQNIEKMHLKIFDTNFKRDSYLPAIIEAFELTKNI